MFTQIIPFLLLLLTPGGQSYSSGAPSSTCNDLIPNHGVDAQRNGRPPFLLTAIPRAVDSIEVNLKSLGNYPFKGFIIQARSLRDLSQIANGKFTPDEQSQTINCNIQYPNTITHKDGRQKYKVRANWKPVNFKGALVFKATVVFEKTIFWTDLYSDKIFVESKETIEEAEKPSSSIPRKSLGKLNKLPSSIQSLYTNCPKNGICTSLPSDCIKSYSCDFLLSASQGGGGNVIFTLSGKTSPNMRWFAVALSDDTKMGDDSVVECYLPDGETNPRIRTSWNYGKSNRDLALNGIEQRVLKNEEGMITCEWKRNSLTIHNDQEFNIENHKFHLLLASGPLQGNGEKRQHVMRSSSPSKVDLHAKGLVSSRSGVNDLILVHGFLMVIVWVGLVSLGIMMARHYKNVWNNHNICNVKVWFAFHRGLMISSIILSAIALITIFVDIGGWRVYNAHPILGIIASALMLVQAVGSLFRNKARPLFNWMHWIGGNLAHILAISAMFMATYLPSAKLHDAFLWLLVGFVIVHFFIHVVMQLHATLSTSTNKVGSNDMNMDPKEREMKEGERGSEFKQFMLGLYVVFLVLFVIALLLLILFASGD